MAQTFAPTRIAGLTRTATTGRVSRRSVAVQVSPIHMIVVSPLPAPSNAIVHLDSLLHIELGYYDGAFARKSCYLS